MPKSISRALRVLFPLHAVPVSTLTEARALAALLTSFGKRAVIYPAQGGYTVSEVAA